MNEAVMNTESTTVRQPRQLWLWWFRRLLLLLVLVILAFFSLSSVIVGIKGGFVPRHVYSVSSPDGRTTLIVTKRVTFPANEIFDPAIIVTVQLLDVASGRVIDSTKLELEEDSDLHEPHVEWTRESARVTGMDDRYEWAFTLKRKA